VIPGAVFGPDRDVNTVSGWRSSFRVVHSAEVHGSGMVSYLSTSLSLSRYSLDHRTLTQRPLHLLHLFH
jgi:hypothetical protein